MGIMIGTGNDVVSFLKQQHEQVKRLFADVHSSQGKERQKAFYALRRFLAVHETAEEEIVHPAAKKKLPNGEHLVDVLLAQETEAKRVLTKLEKMNVDSEEFESKFNSFEQSVLAHAETEERDEFAELGSVLEPERLAKMRRAAEIAEAIAPTRPHPSVDSALGNMIAGPFASMMDRTRDALSGKSS